MTERVTLELPSELAERVRLVAARTQRRFEEVLVDWIDRGGSEPDINSLPDDELLALCESQMEADRQEQLDDLLDRNREGLLTEADRLNLDETMRNYRMRLVRKAQALNVAVARGLRHPLS